jgi:hypothetical protein
LILVGWLDWLHLGFGHVSLNNATTRLLSWHGPFLPRL